MARRKKQKIDRPQTRDESSSRTEQADGVALSAWDMEVFHRNAPAALARRSGEYLFEDVTTNLERILMGTVPIVGLVAFGWSAVEMFAFLLIGLWTSFVCDVVKCLTMYRRVDDQMQSWNRDQHVWAVAQALRTKERRIQTPQKDEMTPAVGLVLDVVFGGIGTAVTFVIALEVHPNIAEQLFANKAFVYGALGFAAYQLLRLIWEVAAHAMGRGVDRPVKVLAGARGIVLFLLMFVVLMSRDYAGKQGDTLKVVMLVVNGLMVGLSSLGMLGLAMMRRETRWLREYLEKRGQGSGARGQ